jgi:putative nucleotidyltransferase with HDIG domain
MLFVTDRPVRFARLFDDLERLAPLTVSSSGDLDEIEISSGIMALICDVDIENEVTSAALHKLIGRARAGLPIVFIVERSTHRVLSKAHALGATLVLPADLPRETLLREIAGVSGLHKSPNGTDPVIVTKDGVRKADEALKNLFDAAQRGVSIPVATVEGGSHAVLSAVRQAGISNWLDVVWTHDDATYQHCLLVAGLAAGFAQSLGFRESDQQIFCEAAIVHDIGKARVPLSVLNKSGRLDAAEAEIMRSHTVLGDEMLSEGGYSAQIRDAVRHHHECLDGSGYPDGLRGGELSDLVRLVTTCDIYAALVERRPYKQPMPAAKALEIMVDMAGKIDQDLVRTFRDVVKAPPPNPAITIPRANVAA